MNKISDNTYLGEIPGFQANSRVQYKIIAYDKANNPAVKEKNGEYYIYTVIPEFPRIIIFVFVVTTLVAGILGRARKKATR